MNRNFAHEKGRAVKAVGLVSVRGKGVVDGDAASDTSGKARPSVFISIHFGKTSVKSKREQNVAPMLSFRENSVSKRRQAGRLTRYDSAPAGRQNRIPWFFAQLPKPGNTLKQNMFIKLNNPLWSHGKEKLSHAQKDHGPSFRSHRRDERAR